MSRKFIQFEVWQECNQNCKFCYNYNTIHSRNDSLKLKNIKFINDFLLTPEINEFNTIGLIGGEFFGGEIKNTEIKQAFTQLITNICNLNNINQILLTSNLMYKDNSFLLEICNLIKSYNKELLICTSYDTIYRFNDNTLHHWISNMKVLSDQAIKTHTQIILTQDFIEEVLSNKFSPTEFEKLYNTSIDYSRPNCGFVYKDKFEMNKILPNFFLKRSDFIKFLIKGCTEGFIDINRFLNVNLLNSHVLYQFIDGKFHRIDNRDKHNTILPSDDVSKSDYIDSDVRIYDDLLYFKSVI